MLVRNNLNDIMKPGKPLPRKDLMVKKALEVIEISPHGQQLYNFAEKKDIQIDIIETPQAVSYLPEDGKIFIGFNKNNPITPAHFILLLVGALRESQQNAAGITHPPLDASKEEHERVSFDKFQDVVWYMCRVAIELNNDETFTEYRFLDELGKMGYNEALQLVMKQDQ